MSRRCFSRSRNPMAFSGGARGRRTLYRGHGKVSQITLRSRTESTMVEWRGSVVGAKWTTYTVSLILAHRSSARVDARRALLHRALRVLPVTTSRSGGGRTQLPRASLELWIERVECDKLKNQPSTRVVVPI